MKAFKLLFACLLALGCVSVAQAADAASQGKHLLTIDNSALATLNALLGTSDVATVTKDTGSVSTTGNRRCSSGGNQPGNADSSATAHRNPVTGGDNAGSNSATGGSASQSGAGTRTLSWQSLLPGSIQ